ncbi:MAG: hypothetical protein AAFO74_01365 [Pseudomonadota bacterium]
MHILDFRRVFVFAMLTLIAPMAMAERWQNPADQYEDAYKAYLGAACPIAEDNVSHFVYFTRDRGRMRGHSFLQHSRFEGAQIMYPWRALERAEGEYDFSIIRSDLDYLKKHGKRLFIQLQDVSFSARYKPVPNYLLDDAFNGGLVPYRANGQTIGWITKRWNPDVQVRFAALLDALGEAFDGEIEGINLQETAIDVSSELDPSFSPQAYAQAIRTNMRNLKAAFPTSTTMQYANFMPGEWLPWEDEGYLRSIYETGEVLGVGLGTPDLMFKRRAQLNHPITMMHEGEFSTPLGIAIQDGNYIGATGADEHFASRQSTTNTSGPMVPILHAFATDFLKVDYMFWVDQKPYFNDQVLPCFAEQ